MKRLDLFVGVSVSLLTAFVAHEAVETRSIARGASFGATHADTVPLFLASTERPVEGPSEVAPAVEPVLDVRRRLELSSEGTYISDILKSRDSALTRWPDRQGKPLRVWVQPSPKLKGFDPAFVSIVYDAFSDWSASGIPLGFTFVFDSTAADIRVTWVNRFSEPISGKTLWAHDANYWIVDADIQLALHHRSGEALDASAMRAIARHEVGHLIGLDHTSDTTTIMTPRVRVRELSPADRATAQLLYMLPAGKVR